LHEQHLPAGLINFAICSRSHSRGGRSPHLDLVLKLQLQAPDLLKGQAHSLFGGIALQAGAATTGVSTLHIALLLLTKCSSHYPRLLHEVNSPAQPSLLKPD
jgi:hypothetical protein